MRFYFDVIKRLLICVLVIILFCEYIIYYVVIYECTWPLLNDKDSFKNGKFIDKAQTLRVMILSDPHLLGSQNGHWFDKLRREWQMKRSFQTAMTFFRPEAVFILGDIFDEGMICSDEVRFQSLSTIWHIWQLPMRYIHIIIVVEQSW